MISLDEIFERKLILLKATKEIYEKMIKMGYSVKDIIDMDLEQEKDRFKMIEKFYEYQPIKTKDQAINAKTLIAGTISSTKSRKEINNNDDFKNLITERINEKYSFGKYGDYKIVIHNETGYVNGTQLLKQALLSENVIRLQINKKKLEMAKIDHWFKLKSTSELMEMISFEEKVKTDQLHSDIKSSKRGEEIIRGTYIHPLLVNSLATWMSPCYALKINKIINELNINAQKKIINDLTSEVKIKCNIIEEMCERYNKISERNEIMIINNEIRFREIMNELKSTSDKLTTTTDELKTTSRTLNKAVKLIKEVKYDTMYIFDIKVSEDSPQYYTCYRILEENAEKTFKKHEGSKIARPVYDKKSVNAREAWKRFKNNNNKVCIKTNGKMYNDFILLNDYTENLLIFDLNNLFASFDNLN